jgi:hypothetical protein
MIFNRVVYGCRLSSTLSGFVGPKHTKKKPLLAFKTVCFCTIGSFDSSFANMMSH